MSCSSSRVIVSESSGRSTAGHLLGIVASGWAKLAITFVVGLVITAMMIREFGMIRFGMFGLIVTLTDLTVYSLVQAVSRSMIREFTTARVRGDDQRLRQIFSCGVVISLTLFAIIALAGIPVQELGVLVLSYAPDLHADLRACILATCVLAGLYVAVTPWQALIISDKKIPQLNFFQLMHRVFDLVAIGIVVVVGPAEGFIAFVWLRAGLRATSLLLMSWYGRSTATAARVDLKTVDRATALEMFRTGRSAMSVPISQLAFYELDQLLLNLFVGPIYNSIYTVSNQIRGYARMAGASIIQGTDALASDLQERGRLDSVRNVLDASVRFPLVITGCGAILLGVFAEPAITVWLFDSIAEGATESAKSTAELIHTAAMFATAMLIGTVIAEPHYTAAGVLYGMGHLKRYSPVLIASAIAKVVLGVLVLSQGFDPISVIVVTVILQFLVYGLYFPWLIADVSDRSMWQMLTTVYARPVLSLVIFAAIALGVRSVVEIESFPMLAVVLAGTGSLYMPLGYFIALRPQERRRIVGMISGRLRRRRTPKADQSLPTTPDPLADGNEI